MTTAEGPWWNIGGFYVSTAGLLLPVVLSPIVWGLAELCRRVRWARIPVALVPAGLGAAFAYGHLSAPSGHAAGYASGAALMTAVTTALSALILLPLRPTRRAGLLGLAAAVVLLATFYGVFLVGHGLGLYDQERDRIRPRPITKPG